MTILPKTRIITATTPIRKQIEGEKPTYRVRAVILDVILDDTTELCRDKTNDLNLFRGEWENGRCPIF